MPLPFALRRCAIALALSCPLLALAAPADSRITQVKVYPGSATVERVARVTAGTRTLSFTCLPAGLDAQSIQVSADAAVRLGETSVLTQPRALSTECATNPLDGRIRDLEDQKAVLQSESDALDLVTGYLKGITVNGGGGTHDDGVPKVRPAAPDAKSVAAMAEALRRTGQDSLQKQHLLKRRQTELDKQLAPLIAERGRTQGQGQGGNVTTVTVTLAAARDADVKLSYQVAGPGWSPAYRALLDTTTRKVRIERQALVAQSTGEDWRGVKLTLSTGQPRRETTGRLPAPWRIGIEQPQPLRERSGAPAASMPAAAPAPMMKAAMDRFDEPAFDVSVFNNSFATEFAVPNAVDVPSSGQRVGLALGQVEDTVKLAARTSPQVDASAFLIADMAPPEGVWPAGPLQLYRDGAFVGNGRWTPPTDARLTLSFGRDELVRVQAEPERDNQGTGGFVGLRAERKLQRGYVVENRHRTPIAVQVLEAAPVSVNEAVEVSAAFQPKPTEREWNKQPGMTLWSFDLAAGESARVAADYTISYPKDVRISTR
ncbi:DUF4139 domain-containing protein [Variovorax robiniae]|uniref:DUF4139 domain-containing protein n=1 Tax=Variovorax robiniae TaxID=1836199 RepID=A0ABU8X9B6_9BURK